MEGLTLAHLSEAGQGTIISITSSILSQTTATRYKTHFILLPNGGTEAWEGKSLARGHMLGRGQSQGHWCPHTAPHSLLPRNSSKQAPNPKQASVFFFFFFRITSTTWGFSGHEAMEGLDQKEHVGRRDHSHRQKLAEEQRNPN